MTSKERRNYIKDIIVLHIEEMIGGTKKELAAKNKKLLKQFLDNDLEVCLWTLNYIEEQYYDWRVEPQDIEVNKNFDRLIYLLNTSLALCSDSLKEERAVVKDYGYNTKVSNELEDFRHLEKKVGL